MLFIILGAFWTIHESVSVVMLSLPSSRASDEEIGSWWSLFYRLVIWLSKNKVATLATVFFD